MRFPADPGWGRLVAVVCGRLPLLAAGPGRGSPPLLAGGSAGGGVGWAPATPWLRVSGAAPRHFWLGSAGRGGGSFRGWGFPVRCVLVARRVRVLPVLVCVVWCVFVVSLFVVMWACAGLPRVFVCVCVCVCVLCWWRAVWCGVVS